MPPPSIPSTTIPSSSASSPIWLPTSSSSPSPPPPFRPQPLLQALLPFVPILALTLLFLFLLRLILRHCLFLRLLFATDTHPTTTTSTSTSSASAQQSRVRQQLAAMESPRSEYNANEITPWMGNEPCDTPPLFLLNSPDMFFPVSGGGAAFLDPSAAAFWLDHQQLVHMLGPMPPKYEDAMKMRPSPPSMPIRPIRPLSIPSLQARGAVRPSDSSPPPCYELANQMPFRPQLGPILATRQQEHPPSYAGTTENSAAESNHHIGIPINDGGVDDASGSVAIGLPIVAPIRRLSSLPPVEQLDRPCSSCSLASLQEAGSKQQQRQQRKMMATIGTFVAKHSSAGRHQRKEEEEEGEGQ